MHKAAGAWGSQPYIGNAEEVELQDANDWAAQVLPLREVVPQPVPAVLPAADERGAAQHKRPLPSGLLDNAAKKCNNSIKNKNGNPNILSSAWAFRHICVWEGIIHETVIIVILTHMKVRLQKCK